MEFITAIGNYLTNNLLYTVGGLVVFMVLVYFYFSRQPKKDVSKSGFDAPTPAARITLGIIGIFVAIGAGAVLVIDLQDKAHHSGHALGGVGGSIVFGIALAYWMFFGKHKSPTS